MRIKHKRILQGMVKSWTANAGVIMAVLGFLQTQQALITKHLGEDATGLLMMAFGMIVVALRVKTTESLETKGAK